MGISQLAMHTNEKDKLIWGMTPNGSFSIKEAYNIPINANEPPTEKKWENIWKRKLWPKIANFSWKLMKNRNLTGKILMK